MNARPVVATAVALLVAATLAGCGRSQRLEYRGGDSTASAKADSATLAVRAAQQAWDAPGGGEQAAQLTAAALARTLATVPTDLWGTTARAYLDSLGVGAEVAEAKGAVAVNFFSRSDPTAGSWPWLVWATKGAPGLQPIEGRQLRLQRAVSRGLPPAGGRDSAATVAALFDRRVALGTEPLLMAWRLRAGAWDIAQTLGADSLGGAGTGDFEAHGDSVLLVTRTYRASRGFEECPTCPHVYRVRRFVWGPQGFTRLDEHELPSPYSTFVRFVQALGADDRVAAESWVTDGALADAARKAGFGQPKGLWRVAPATDETATRMVFLRGANETYEVHFVQRDDAWLIDAITTTERRVE